MKLYIPVINDGVSLPDLRTVQSFALPLLKPYAVVVCIEMLLCIVVCAYCLSLVEKRRGVLYAANVQQNFSAIVLLDKMYLKMLISHLIP